MKNRTLSLSGVWSVALLVLALTSCRPQAVTPAAGGLTVFKLPTFEFILPETRPTPAQVTSTLTLTATPGEIEPVSCGLLAAQDLPAATVTLSDLTGPQGAVIPAAALEARVALVWEQKGIRGKNMVRLQVPEALVRDDRLNFLDPQYTPLNLPSEPPDAPVHFSLRRGESRQLWLTVTVPADAVAGEYTGQVRVGAAQAPATISLTLTVLPFKLAETDKIIGMFYNDNLGAETPLSVYRARLAKLRSMGVTSLRLLGNRETLEAELTEIKAAGFAGPIVVWDQSTFFEPKGLNDMKFTVATLQGMGFEPYVYGVDEPNDPSAAPRQRHSLQGQLIAYRRIKQCGAKVVTALTPKTHEILTRQHNQPLDFALYNPSDNTGFAEYVAEVQANPQARQHEREGYYFGCWSENPRRNRLLAGFYLHNCGLDAAFGWTFYTYHIKDQPQAFNDFDLEANKKRWLTVFPTREGCLPTLQSEAFREGVDDLRYLATFLQLAADRERDLGPAAVAPLRRQVLAEVARYRDLGPNKPEDQTGRQYTNQQFEDSRTVIIKAILQLQALVPMG